MALTVHILYTGTNGTARAFAQEMMDSGTVEKIRKEEGNLSYTYYFPMEDAESVLLIDSWENQEAIDRHHASEMMQTIFDLREKYDLHMNVQRYVSVDDIPEHDKAFIKE